MQFNLLLSQTFSLQKAKRACETKQTLCTYDFNIGTIEEGRERHVTSYLRQWTQLIRLHGWGVEPVQPYSCPEMWLYWQDYSRPCGLSSRVLLAQIWRQQHPFHSLYI